MDPSIIEPVELTAAWVVGGLVTLVGAILLFVQRLVLDQFRGLRQEINQLRGEMLNVMSKSLDIAVTKGNNDRPAGKGRPES